MREYLKPEYILWNKTQLQQVCIDTKEKIMLYDENCLAYIEEATRNQSYMMPGINRGLTESLGQLLTNYTTN